jgi:hypothetical protein
MAPQGAFLLTRSRTKEEAVRHPCRSCAHAHDNFQVIGQVLSHFVHGGAKDVFVHATSAFRRILSVPRDCRVGLLSSECDMPSF